MARPIGMTPSLEGEEAREFLKKMKQTPSDKDKEFKKKLDSLERIVPF